MLLSPVHTLVILLPIATPEPVINTTEMYVSMVHNQLYEVNIFPPDHSTMEFPPSHGSWVQNGPGIKYLTGLGAAGPDVVH